MRKKIKRWREKIRKYMHKRFIKRIVNNAVLNSKDTYDQSRGKTSRLPCSETEWKNIKKNIKEINEWLSFRNVKIEIIYPTSKQYEIKIIKLD